MYHITCVEPVKFRENGVDYEYVVGDVLRDYNDRVEVFATFDITWMRKWKMKYGKCFKIVNTRAKNPK